MQKLRRREFIKLGLGAAVGAALAPSIGVLLEDVKSHSVATGTKEAEGRVPLFCGACGANCGLMFVQKGNLKYILPNLSHPQPGMCFRSASAIQIWNHPLRLKKPLKRVGARGEGKFTEIDWETALNEIAAKLKGVVEKYGAESVAFTRHDHMAWILPFIAFTLGTPNVVGHEGTCHAASTVARRFTLGAAGPPTIDPDYANVRYLLLIGRILDAAMGQVRSLEKARKLGLKVVVVDPRFPNLAFSSSEWVPIYPGTDAAFALSMIHVIIDEKLYDEDFLKRYTNAPFLIKPDGHPLMGADIAKPGVTYLVYDKATKELVEHDKAKDPALDYKGSVETTKGIVEVKTALELLKERAAKYPPEKAEKITGVPASTIIRIAREFAEAKGVAEDGWYTSKNGNDFDAYRAIQTLNILVGNIDKKGGLCYREDARFPPSTRVVREEVETILGYKLPLPKQRRIDLLKYPETPSCFDAVLDGIVEEKPYPIKALFIVGTAPFQRDVNYEKLKKAFEKLELVVTFEILPQDHVDWCDYVLPDLMFLEGDEIGIVKWTLHAAVQKSHKVLDPPPGVDARDAFWALMEIIRRAFPDRARAVGYTEKYADPRKFKEYEEEITKKIIEGLATAWKLSPDVIKRALDKDGFFILKKKAYEVCPYVVEARTPSKKLEIYTLHALTYKMDPLPDWRPPAYTIPRAPNEFYLVNGKDQQISAHALFTKNAKWLVERRVWMNINDAKRLGISTDDEVELKGIDTGIKARAKVWVTTKVREGVLYTYSFAGGRSSRLISPEYNFLKEGINPVLFTTGKVEPVSGSAPTNASVEVRKI